MTISCDPTRDVPIIGSAIGNGQYQLVFSYQLWDQFVYDKIFIEIIMTMELNTLYSCVNFTNIILSITGDGKRKALCKRNE